VGGHFTVLDLSSHEIAAGGAFVWPLAGRRSIGATLDFSHLQLQRNEFIAAINTISLGVTIQQ
jgi:hypothetical protein